MKLVRFGLENNERPGVVDSKGKIRDLSSVISDLEGDNLSPESLEKLNAIDIEKLALAPSDVRLGPPVTGVRKIVCVGLNYRDHAEECKLDIPEEPLLFMKAASSISGPFDDIVFPKGSEKGDWEVELGIVIGSKATNVEECSADKYIAGYCIVNDVCERAFQLEHGGQWCKGKSADTFAPIGPWLVTTDEIKPDSLPIALNRNGERMQDSNTKHLIFNVAQLVSYISKYMTLEPGDIIATGTPGGVGLGYIPPKYLKPGDELELSISGLGVQRQVVRFN